MTKTKTKQVKAVAGKPVTKGSKAAKPTVIQSAKGTAVSKPLTKKARLIELLGTKGGVTIAVISEELGWLQHTTRAALTGLRKAGFTISASKPDGGGAGR